MKIFILGNSGKKAIYFRGTREQVPSECLMRALISSPFIRKELQLTFYANETTSLLYGRICRDDELHPQYLNNPETVKSTVESVCDKTNILICRPSEVFISLGIRRF